MCSPRRCTLHPHRVHAAHADMSTDWHIHDEHMRARTHTHSSRTPRSTAYRKHPSRAYHTYHNATVCFLRDASNGCASLEPMPDSERPPLTTLRMYEAVPSMFCLGDTYAAFAVVDSWEWAVSSPDRRITDYRRDLVEASL